MVSASYLPRGLLVVAVLLATVGMAGSSAGTQAMDAKSPADVTLVAVDENGSTALWPYTSRETRFETLTLPINVVVRAEPDRVGWMLRRDESGEFASAESGHDSHHATVHWQQADGATRYTYVGSHEDETGTWTDEHSQLHVGTYFGKRHHVRLYAVPGEAGDATAIQAHREYWDWFRLRHTVDSNAAGQMFVEREFARDGRTEAVRHERYGNGGIIDSDGWVSVVDVRDGTAPPGDGTNEGASGDRDAWPALAGTLATVCCVGIASTSGRTARATVAQVRATVTELRTTVVGMRATVTGVETTVTDALDGLPGEWPLSRAHGLLFGGLAFLPLLVRVGSIAAEEWMYVTGPKGNAAVFYLLLVVGLPACAYRFAAGLGAAEGALVAILGFGAGVIADYTFLGVVVVPKDALSHRVALALALAVVAAAGTVRRDRRLRENELLAVGAVCWVAAVAWPLLDTL